MLKVQEYLRSGNSLSRLESELGIANKLHPTDGRVILDYDMIKSPKLNPIVRECRGLTLDSSTYDLVARSFTRFLNAGESREEDSKFNWDNDVLCTHKEDGSMIKLFFHNGEWKVETRFSFADSLVNESIYTWRSLVLQGFDFEKANLNTEYIYILELCSLYNKIVRSYNGVQTYLLTVFHGETELNWSVTQDIATELGLKSPQQYVAKDIMDAQAYLSSIANNDVTFEGLVMRDVFNHRLKMKSPTYLQLHRLNNNGNVASVKNLLPLIMAGEKSEILTYFPELQDSISKIEAKLNTVKQEIDNVWYTYSEEKSPKKFALAIQKDTKYTAPLFNARKSGGHPHDYLTSEYLVKNVFN